MALGELIQTIGFKVDPRPTERGAAKAKAAIKGIGSEAQKTTGKVGKVFGALSGKIGAAFSVVAVTLFFKAAVEGAAKYQTAMISVLKVTDFTATETAAFRKEIAALGKVLPQSVTSLLGISAAAGQLGVKGVANIVKFTETVGRLASATDIVGEDGAKKLARVLNILGEGIDTVDGLGDALVTLGNNFAASESEIVKMTLELSKGLGIFGSTSDEVTALSAVLVSLGQQPELASSAIGKTFRTISEILIKGGEDAEDLGIIFGKSAEDIKKAFDDNAMDTVVEFLSRVNQAGERGGLVLERFGLKGEEISKSLPVLAANLHLVADAQDLIANKDGALFAESEKSADSYESKLVLMMNAWAAIKRQVGEQILPFLETGFQSLARFMDSLVVSTNDATTAFTALGQAASTAIALAADSFSQRALAKGANVLAAVLDAPRNILNLNSKEEFRDVEPNAAVDWLNAFSNRESNRTGNTEGRMAREADFAKTTEAAAAMTVELAAVQKEANVRKQALFMTGLPEGFIGPLDGREFGPQLPPKPQVTETPLDQGTVDDILGPPTKTVKAKLAGGSGGSRGSSSRGPSTVMAQVRDVREIAKEEFGFESFTENLARVQEAMAGAFNPEFLVSAREELEILDAVMRDKVLTGAAEVDDAFKFGLLKSIEEVGTASQQAFDLAQDVFGSVANGFTSAFTSIIDGSKSAGDAFNDMAVGILRDISAMIVKQLIFNAIAGVVNAAVPGLGTTLQAAAGPVARTNHSGKRERGGGQGGTTNLSRGLQSDEQLTVIKNNELVLRPQDVDAMQGSGSRGGGPNVTITTNVNVASDGQRQTETQATGDAASLERFAESISQMVDQRVGEMIQTPGSPLYKS